MRYGSGIDPPNRFDAQHRHADFDHLEWDEDPLAPPDRPVEYLPDASRSIISQNDSPDIAFRYSINPYRGCQHGCSYCYARNTHEYLGLNAGLDFETKILVKHEAAALFRDALADESWEPDEVVFSGVTDCYQPAERTFRLTRQCLEVAAECGLPVGIVTKNALIVRDLDLLGPLAARGLVRVALSVSTLDAALARVMEPRTSIPAARLRAMTMLAEAGVPVRALVAPIIPGLNDTEIPAVLAAAAEAGAHSASFTLLRLPLTVEPVFLEWLHREQPLKAQKIEALIRATRGGRLNQSDFRRRMRGQGEIADQVRRLFQVFQKKHGLDRPSPPPNLNHFRRPPPRCGQLRLF